MPLSPDSLSSIDDVANRLAAESILAQPGRDDGLIPAYSLLSELADLCAGDSTLVKAVQDVRGILDKMLDNAQPFDDTSLGKLRKLVVWLPKAVSALRGGKAVPEFEEGAKPTVEAVPKAEVPAAPAVAVDDGLAQYDQVLDLNMGENRELLVEFHAEALDHLQQIEAALLALDETPDDPEALNSIFRSFHTIKGVSGFLHLTPMHTLTHEVESLLDLARNRKMRLNSTIITEILKSRDAVQQMVQQITVALEQDKMPSVVVPVSHLMRAVKRMAAGDHSPNASVAPSAAPAPVAPKVEAPKPVAEVAQPLAPVVDFPAAPAAETAPKKSEGKGGGENKGASSTVRVNTDKLDALMDVVGELVIVQSQLTESARVLGIDDTMLQRNIAQFGRLTKELQHSSMSLRMIPVKPTFQKMERLARDLSRDFGKKVNFHVSGEDTDLDRTVVEDIGDPLVHMVRNSLDHGLEMPADRVVAGKPEAGNVYLKAYYQGSSIVIELSDDGRGINPEKVIAKAKKQGLIHENAQPSKEEALNLIFLPGFSTAEKVTAVSGRGVGMDVVKRNIEKLRGKIEIVSEVGKGSTFKIKLPLTMAIIDGLVVRVGED
ncbi:MAG TPA: chemotaxis protein CheA, partial [Opitutaceae bacterium]